jgi:hypothetical protein
MLILLPSNVVHPSHLTQWGRISATARSTILTDFLESRVGNDALLVAILILEKRRNHKRQNQVSKECHELQS